MEKGRAAKERGELLSCFSFPPQTRRLEGNGPLPQDITIPVVQQKLNPYHFWETVAPQMVLIPGGRGLRRQESRVGPAGPAEPEAGGQVFRQ